MAQKKNIIVFTDNENINSAVAYLEKSKEKGECVSSFSAFDAPENLFYSKQKCFFDPLYPDLINLPDNERFGVIYIED